LPSTSVQTLWLRASRQFRLAPPPSCAK
jgi:hypothetical protein